MKTNNTLTDTPVQISTEKETLFVSVTGNIVHFDNKNIIQTIQSNINNRIKNIIFINNNLQKWDSSLLLLVFETICLAKDKKISYSLDSMPKNLQELITLAFAVNRKPTHKTSDQKNFLEEVGFKTLNITTKIKTVCKYIGEILSSIGRWLSANSVMRGTDFLSALDDCGPKALGIVSLISFLVGLILAFVGAVQLQMFGAQIYVASLVTIGMCRIMGAIMVGIIIAGRTGSAYAATIGTMQVNEELDALQTMGLSRIDFLVLPRLLSLLIAMPILTMLADFMGMIGGAFVGIFMMNLPYQEYWKYAIDAFTLNNFLVGIFHGFCFGFIIALCGCYCGLTCGRNADSVGVATTRSVVNAIVWMIVVTGIITVICQELGI